MKTYEEMIQLVCDQVTKGAMRLRYDVWTAYIILGVAFDKTEGEVGNDVQAELNRRDAQIKAERKAANRASNEQRRLANLAKVEVD